ncbi:Ran-binding protein in the microtubule-organising centre protein [Citrus sinensis]|uniref:Ran-binding protein in the microtubule-organising centre protein n=1 Tax=Citrus sinensis TaxID=2711 RepID=A0ACB8J2I8_CITSI|nr:Ran-binding protein in the microtubule-organising centre protein [Citrus sinensis]
MESTPVNWEALDALILEFAKSENLIEDSIVSSPPSSPSSSSTSSVSLSSSSYHSRLIIRQIRRSLEYGDIDAAIDLLRAHAPFILDDHRLLFRLQKQEAYEEFKHVLLAFIYDKDDPTSPVAKGIRFLHLFILEPLWAERRRFEIAGLMSSVLRAHLHAYDPVFAMTLRYLISIHKEFCFHQGVPSPISDLTDRLLLEERDPPATPQESLYEAPPFDEVDIQALAHAVKITRQGAVDSLRFARGDLFQAFQNELCQMRLDVSMLDELVREYCVYRGIVDSGLSTPSGTQTISIPIKVDKPESGCCSSRNCSLEMDCSISKNSDVETSVSNTIMDGSSENNTDVISIQGADVELRFTGGPTGSNEDCSTSGSHQPESSRGLRSRSHGSGERNKRKRWRGRQDDFCYNPEISLGGCNKRELNSSTLIPSTIMSREQQGLEKNFTSDVNCMQENYEIVLGMKELAGKGMAAEAVEEINAMDADFFVQNPMLLFQLKQVEFLKLVSCGDHSGALRVACAHLGPLAASHPALLKPLKETLLALLQPNEDVLVKGFPLHTLATSLQVAIGRRLGIEEPQLMKILRATLHTHNEWFKLQMCKDRFESLLRIDLLKEVYTPFLATVAMSKSHADSTQGSSQITISSNARVSEDGSSPNQVSSADFVCDENAILKVMEFLALPRADAIHLLAQYNGNAETVIQQIFA